MFPVQLSPANAHARLVPVPPLLLPEAGTLEPLPELEVSVDPLPPPELPPVACREASEEERPLDPPLACPTELLRFVVWLWLVTPDDVWPHAARARKRAGGYESRFTGAGS
jgi:hypothetical protein